MRARGVTPVSRAWLADINTTAAAPSVMPDDVPAVMMPAMTFDLAEHERQLAQALDGRVRSWVLVGRHRDRLPSGIRHGDRSDLVVEPPAAIAAAARRCVSSA